MILIWNTKLSKFGFPYEKKCSLCFMSGAVFSIHNWLNWNISSFPPCVPLPVRFCAITVNLLYIKKDCLHSMNTDWEIIHSILGALCITCSHFISEPDQDQQSKYKKKRCLLNVVFSAKQSPWASQVVFIPWQIATWSPVYWWKH